VLFEIFVIVATVIVLFVLNVKDKDIKRKFLITFISVLLFEYFTSALWINKNLEYWAYLYKGVSWIITLGWTSIILASIALVNYTLPKLSEGKRFIVQLLVVSVVGFFAEILVRLLGIRDYSALAQKAMSGVMIGGVPIEAIYYIPVFMALVISFKRYWEISFNEKKIIEQPISRRKNK